MIGMPREFLPTLLLGLCMPTASALPAFEGAEGFGSETPHARGTQVCRVTSLLDAGIGSVQGDIASGDFRFCLEQARTRGGAYIIPVVSGSVRLRRHAYLPSNVYIAGQASPGGIAFEGHPLIVEAAQDVLIRHIRHRESVPMTDALRVEGADRVVFDHVSVSGFKDGAIDIVDARDVTVSWSQLGDAVDSGDPTERYHGQPNLIRTGADRISLHHNYYTHAHTRVPLVYHSVKAPDFRIGFVNNVIYNYGKYPSKFEARDGLAHIVGNIWIPGRNTHADTADGLPPGRYETLPDGATHHGFLKPPVIAANGMGLYLRDNLMLDGVGHDASNFTDRHGKQIHIGRPGPVTGVRTDDAQPEDRIVARGRGTADFRLLTAPAPGMPAITVYPVRENMARVLQSVGALPRDNTDRRLVSELHSRTGAWKFQRPADHNSYPGPALPDADGDGLPDAFEAAHGGALHPLGRDLDPTRDNIELWLDARAAALLLVAERDHAPGAADQAAVP